MSPDSVQRNKNAGVTGLFFGTNDYLVHGDRSLNASLSDAGLYFFVLYRLRWAAVVGLFSCVATVCWLCISLLLMLKLRAPVLFCIKQQHLTMVTRGTVYNVTEQNGHGGYSNIQMGFLLPILFLTTFFRKRKELHVYNGIFLIARVIKERAW